MTSKQKILVTGAGGFLGGYILRDLITTGQYEVYALKRTQITRSIYKDPEQQVQWVEADLLDVPALAFAIQNVDVIVHCAAKVSYHRKHRKEMYRVNQSGTANLINCALDQGIQKFIHISSIAAIGRPPQTHDLHEKLEWSSSSRNTHYALSKKLAELEVLRGFAEGLEGTILNPSIILGTGYWDQGTALIFKKVFEGLKAFPTGHTGFVDVRDVSKAVLKAIELPCYNDRIILSGTNLSYRELLTKIATLFGKEPPRTMLSKSLIQFLKPLANLGEFVFGNAWHYTSEILGNTSFQYAYINQRSKEVLGISYRPLETTLKDITEIWKLHYPNETVLLSV